MTYARTHASLPGTIRCRASVTPCDSTWANSTPPSVAAQPLPTTTLPAATVGCDAESRAIAPHAIPDGTVNTSCVADCDVTVAAVAAILTAETSDRPVPAIV